MREAHIFTVMAAIMIICIGVVVAGWAVLKMQQIHESIEDSQPTHTGYGMEWFGLAGVCMMVAALIGIVWRLRRDSKEDREDKR